jgi:anti-sigma factor RsiW
MSAQTPWFRQYVTCEEVVTFLLSYLSGELSEEKERDFEQHLAVCPSCVAYLKTYRATVELGKSLRAEEPGTSPPELAPELVRAILAGRPPAPTS